MTSTRAGGGNVRNGTRPKTALTEASVAAALQRATQGLEDYLVVRAPSGQPVGKIRVVEDNNPRARRLYERLGYQAAGRQHASWEYEDKRRTPAV